KGVELSKRATEIFQGYALACAGIKGTEIAGLEYEEKLAVYREFAAATLDLDALVEHQAAPWFRDVDAFRNSDFKASERLPSDDDKLAEWIELAVQWHLSRN
ncbi:MAG: hypothetical protein R3B54_15120, partial [Bdellovibrionota bacterium]